MKLLKGQTEIVKSEHFEVEVDVITTAMQATLAAMSREQGIDARQRQISYALKNCVKTLTVDGVPVNPADVADKSDISDTETLDLLLKLGQAVIGVAFPTAEELKK